MITVSTTSQAEAQAVTRILAEEIRPDWDFRVFVNGNTYAARAQGQLTPAALPAGQVLPADPRRLAALQLIREAGPAGITEPQLRGRLVQKGFDAARETVHRWLEDDAETGLISRTGAGWTWTQPLDDPAVRG